MTISNQSTIKTITYFSSSRIVWKEAELVQLLTRSREYNQEMNVTGFLIYVDGSFLQWIEGPTEGIDDVYQRINSDPRHAQISAIFEGVLGERHFPNWSMAYLPGSEVPPELISDFISLREVKEGGGFMVHAPRLAKRIAENFLSTHRV